MEAMNVCLFSDENYSLILGEQWAADMSACRLIKSHQGPVENKTQHVEPKLILTNKYSCVPW